MTFLQFLQYYFRRGKHAIASCLLITFILSAQLFTGPSYNLLKDAPTQKELYHDETEIASVKHASNLNIVTEKDFPLIKPELCRRSPVIRVGNVSDYFMICAKPKKVDGWISVAIAEKGIWEGNLVRLVLRWLSWYPEATFLDLGANIGVFSVAAAAFGSRVVSVDPILANLAYVYTSAQLTGVSDNITFINNPVSNEERVLFPWNREPKNEGAVTLITPEEALVKDAKLIGSPITSVTLEQIFQEIPSDIVIIKIDVEGYECKVLGDFLKSKVKTKTVPLIVMEWDKIENGRDGLCPNSRQLLQDFVDSGYKPHTGDNLRKLSVQDKFPGNVIWIHKDIKNIQLLEVIRQEAVSRQRKKGKKSPLIEFWEKAFMDTLKPKQAVNEDE